MDVVDGIHLEYGGGAREAARRWEAARRHAKQPFPVGPAIRLLLVRVLLRNLVAPDASVAHLQGTVAEEGALSRVDDVVAFVAGPDADRTDARVPRQPASVAVVPVLLLVVLTRPEEGALFLRPRHVLGVVGLAIVEHLLLVAL